ncbi:flagellar protein FlgN [Citrobacter rodentium]|uniref:Lateral flagellar chaperone protein n=2 Tax=Citrobacter rodentium TaxID=67825 RepID=D2TJ78_CITRI|nr:flagellar protein FlgN [Citrobacter rodentium]KIQ51739.1 flagellar biosynthesis protein FlgN [Citrobacter rodentium]QBY31540.1 flagellar protein FlgN [Citrobacter rodentium]UHO31104.1 flagellar protein FlgN [Citrobacter rodentium NBRC 105723 = DSM 16636]CBG87085.1 lateral flagellar chaperone protein [Citrobacter rodentium ICC168]HAT8014119.1 flagellar protein FlgN [Citrobacter rodentium NBRC 105723 = DSM 16636]
MSTRLQQVKMLLQGIREDDTLYDGLRNLLEQQRLCMIRRASEELLAVNETIHSHYELLKENSRQRRTLLQLLGVSASRAGMEEVFSWLPAPQKSAARSGWQRLEHKAERCKAYNEKNGDLLIRQYVFIQSFLGTEADFIYQP